MLSLSRAVWPTGYDARAHAKSIEDVKALLQRVFKLEPARQAATC